MDRTYTSFPSTSTNCYKSAKKFIWSFSKLFYWKTVFTSFNVFVYFLFMVKIRSWTMNLFSFALNISVNLRARGELFWTDGWRQKKVKCLKNIQTEMRRESFRPRHNVYDLLLYYFTVEWENEPFWITLYFTWAWSCMFNLYFRRLSIRVLEFSNACPITLFFIKWVEIWFFIIKYIDMYDV